MGERKSGKFTIGTDFTGLTVLKSWMIALAGGSDSLKGNFDTVRYEKYSHQLWYYINRTKKYWWKQGQTFPNAVAPMHQMFSNGELYLTMSNNDGEVDNKSHAGIIPSTSRSYVYDGGTIQNSHYIGITKHARNIAGAMVVCNFLISSDAQYEKLKTEVWATGRFSMYRAFPQNGKGNLQFWQKENTVRSAVISNRRHYPNCHLNT